ncbi:choline transport protein [Rhizoctonia solani]|uniref:Choline transport protein n=1 Tax=Rhizoctonia solani TaxID=456999 RepID=A0A8H8PBE9_9AGAM|nr:choline transport protein [Rhizoctonia solani]QRW27126.1 choline transport protein [Rhizoctonia solani]
MNQQLPTVDIRLSNPKPRTLVLCFDGTTNVYDNTNTNVVKLFSLLKRDRRDEQMVYYQPGIGTYAPPGIFLPLTMALAKIADQGIALYLDKHVMGGYQFLMKHYSEGDRICLFGFSRGAYTARALAGMLHKVGLLPPDNVEQISFAYQMYKRTDLAGYTESVGFKKTFSREVKIEFMGVWDTVSSVGLLWPRHLPFTSSNSIVKTFRHAVSLDERRAKFKQNVWHVDSPTPHRDPEQGSPCTNLKQPRAPSPTLVRSPATTLPYPSKGNKPKSKKGDANTAVAVATLSLQGGAENNASDAGDQPPLQNRQIQTDLRNFFPEVQSPGVHEENRGGPADESWHSREPTRVKGTRPDSGVDGLDIESTEATAKISGKAPQTLLTIKSDVNLASALQSGVGVAASIGVAGEKCEPDDKESNGIMSWLRSRGKPKKQSTHLSGGGKFEAAIEQQISDGENTNEQETDVLEVWFAGCHSDVGGGEERNDAEYSLSNISLRWMVRQIILSQCGIQFNNDALREMKIPLPTLRFDKSNPLTLYSSPADSAIIEEAQKQERRDALAPLHDALRNPLWWSLEFFPLVHSYQTRKEIGISNRWNLFSPRHARKTLKVVKVHQSVKYRMEQMEKEMGKSYKPRALIDGFEEGHIEWVD